MTKEHGQWTDWLSDWLRIGIGCAVLCCTSSVHVRRRTGVCAAQHACIATLHSIKFTLRKSWRRCMRERDHTRSPEINHDQFYLIFCIYLFFLPPTTHTFIRCVSFALFMLIFHRPSSSSPALLHFARQIVLKSFAAHAGRHTGWRHSSRHATISMCVTYSIGRYFIYFFLSYRYRYIGLCDLLYNCLVTDQWWYRTFAQRMFHSIQSNRTPFVKELYTPIRQYFAICCHLVYFWLRTKTIRVRERKLPM